MQFAEDAAQHDPTFQGRWEERNITQGILSKDLMKWNNGIAVDVLCATHVLEHLLQDPAMTIAGWLCQAAHTVTIALPLEPNPASSVSDHPHGLTLRDLTRIGSQVRQVAKDRGLNVNVDYRFLSGGLLIFERESGF